MTTKRAPPPPTSPRERAKKRLESLSRGAALTVSAAIAPVCAACDPLPPPPPQQTACAPSDDVGIWLNASAFFDNTLDNILFVVNINPGMSGVSLANTFTATGATLVGAPVFDSGSLSTSQSVTLTLAPAGGANEIVVETGASCDGEARAVRFSFTVAEVTNSGAAFPGAEDITP